MAAVPEMALLTGARMACSSGRPLQGGAVAISPVAGLHGSYGSSAHRAALPSCRGLKVKCTGRSAFKILSSPKEGPKGIVCEAPETVVGCGVVSESNFKALVLESDIPVLVDFWAPWCGPCRMISPLIDELARQYAGKVRCLKLNTDESPGIATEYGIRSIPTVMIFKGGEKKDTVIGAVPKSTLTATLEKYIN